VYTHNGHVIDVYVWPSETRRASEHDVRRGFELVHWADGAMQVWTVSDLERGELERFAQAWQERAAAR
jgi:anti-sigma factor RsiW